HVAYHGMTRYGRSGCDREVEIARPEVGQDGIMRRVGNPPAGTLRSGRTGRFAIGRKLPACPTKSSPPAKKQKCSNTRAVAAEAVGSFHGLSPSIKSPYPGNMHGAADKV